MSLEVSDAQKATLTDMLAALPSEAVDEPVQGAGKLAGLFYHPNSGCRVMALVLSAGFDAVGGRSDNAVKKVDRAIQVFTLVSDDAEGRGQLEGLKGQLSDDIPGFLEATRNTVVPYLQQKMTDVQIVAKPKPTAKPRAIEDGEEIPDERRTETAAKPKRERELRRAKTEPMMEPVAEPAAEEPAAEPASDDSAEPAAAAAPAEAEAPAADAADDDGVGPSEAEAAAAAAAALAAMEAPYEEVVTDDSPPRFDPDRDLKPDDGRRRRRRSRSPEGLERLRPDQRPPVKESEAADAPAADGSGDDQAQAAPAREPVKVTRSSHSDEIAESGLEALKLALRRARELGFEGQLAVEVTIGAGEGDGQPGSGARRRRRRRRGGRGRSSD